MTDPTPDHVPCRHCGKPISWDEICWTHDDSGFADCGVVFFGGTKINEIITVGVQMGIEMEHKGKHAEPVGEWS